MSFYDFASGGIAFAAEISKNHLGFDTFKAFNGEYTGSSGASHPWKFKHGPSKISIYTKRKVGIFQVSSKVAKLQIFLKIFHPGKIGGR